MMSASLHRAMRHPFVRGYSPGMEAARIIMRPSRALRGADRMGGGGGRRPEEAPEAALRVYSIIRPGGENCRCSRLKISWERPRPGSNPGPGIAVTRAPYLHRTTIPLPRCLRPQKPTEAIFGRTQA